MKPKYPIFIPSKGRYEYGLTMRAFEKDDVPYTLVVEPQDLEGYERNFPKAENILVLPENDQGLVYARNFISDHAREIGCKRHWQIDDNIRRFRRYHRITKIPCHAGLALRWTERFADRYENVGIAGMNYDMFAVSTSPSPPFRLNCHVYSIMLMLTDMPYRWRPPANEDVDMCLQVIAGGYCTVQMVVYLAEKLWTEVQKGGMTDLDYKHRDRRLQNARALERRWPGVVRVVRRFGRSHFRIANEWKYFDTPLKRREDLDWEAIEKSKPPGGILEAVKEVESEWLKKMLREDQAEKA